jgi:hypothetical protein
MIACKQVSESMLALHPSIFEQPVFMALFSNLLRKTPYHQDAIFAMEKPAPGIFALTHPTARHIYFSHPDRGAAQQEARKL